MGKQPDLKLTPKNIWKLASHLKNVWMSLHEMVLMTLVPEAFFSLIFSVVIKKNSSVMSSKEPIQPLSKMNHNILYKSIEKFGKIRPRQMTAEEWTTIPSKYCNVANHFIKKKKTLAFTHFSCKAFKLSCEVCLIHSSINKETQFTLSALKYNR